MTAPAMGAVRGGRAAIYGRLERRNRVIAVLRVLVPGIGALALAGLLIQLVVSNAASRFTLSRIETLPQTFAIDTPEYAGILPDGGTYRVWAESARPDAGGDGLVTLSDAAVTLERADGTRMNVNAEAATMSTATEEVFIPDIARIEDSTGTAGSVSASVLDWGAQTLDSTGPVAIEYRDGTALEADAMHYDLAKGLWTFEGVRVTLQDTPGVSAP